MPLLGAAFAAPTENSRIQGLLKAFEVFSSDFKTDLIFKEPGLFEKAL